MIEILRGCLTRLKRDRNGTTAVEFAMVGVPFLMLCFGVITVGLHFLTTYTLENAVERAGRLIRTCQAQNNNMDATAFKNEIMRNGASYVDPTKMHVYVQNWERFSEVQPRACLGTDGNLAGGGVSGNIIDSSGSANRVVLVTVCYEWELASRLPFLRLGKMSNGSALIQASTTFRTEPCQ